MGSFGGKINRNIHSAHTYQPMNQHLENKKKRYEKVKSSWCFCNNLVGLAAIELNVTELCSRHCAFCPRFDRNVYKNQNLHMTIETIISLAEKCESERYEGDISIAGFGEPMLHPNLPEIVRSLRRHLKNQISLITNGDFLTKDSLNDLVSAGLSKIVVSCYDGPDAKEKFESLLSTTEIDYHVKELWGNFDKIVKKNDFNSRTGLVPIHTKTIGKQCYLPFYKLMIDWNGEVILCSNDWLRKESDIGNINNTSLKSIWFGDKLKSIRTNLRAGNRCGDACKYCNVNGTLIGKDSFDLIPL